MYIFLTFTEFAQLSLRARLTRTTARSRKSLTSRPAKWTRGPSPSWTRGLTSYLSCWTLTRRSGRGFSTAPCSAAASASRRSWVPAASASRSASMFTATPAWLNTSRSRSATGTFSALIVPSPSAPPLPRHCRWWSRLHQSVFIDTMHTLPRINWYQAAQETITYFRFVSSVWTIFYFENYFI